MKKEESVFRDNVSENVASQKSEGMKDLRMTFLQQNDKIGALNSKIEELQEKIKEQEEHIIFIQKEKAN